MDQRASWHAVRAASNRQTTATHYSLRHWTAEILLGAACFANRGLTCSMNFLPSSSISRVCSVDSSLKREPAGPTTDLSLPVVPVVG